MNENDPKNFSNFVNEYKGAIIGGAVAILVIALGVSKLLVGLLIVAAGILLGNYIQNNKETVRETLKEFLDKIF